MDSVEETSRQDMYGMVEDFGTDPDSIAEIAEEVVELDRKVGLLTEANANLEQERDLLVDEKVSC